MDITEEFNFPIIEGPDFGYSTPNLPFPMGLKARMTPKAPRSRLTRRKQRGYLKRKDV